MYKYQLEILGDADTKIRMDRTKHQYVSLVDSSIYRSVTCLLRDFCFGPYTVRKYKDPRDEFLADCRSHWYMQCGTTIHDALERIFSPDGNAKIATGWHQRLTDMQYEWDPPRLDLQKEIYDKVDWVPPQEWRVAFEEEFDTNVYEHRLSQIWYNIYQGIDSLFTQYEPIASEYMVYNPTHQIAGTIDLLLRHKETGKLAIVDWKTTESVVGPIYERNCKTDKPLVPKCTKYQVYRCQLHIYARLIQEMYKEQIAQFIIFNVACDGVMVMFLSADDHGCNCWDKIIV